MDYLVALVAVVFGTALVLGAGANAAWLMELAKVRGLAAGMGSTPARILCALIGALLILVGILVAAGWRPGWAAHPAARLDLQSRP